MSFHTLPLEIVGLVAALLDFPDILTLRLTSRTIRAILSEKSTNSRLFSQKQVYLTRASLTSMIQIMRPGSAACALQHCTITGFTGVTLTPNRVEEYKQLLTAAFSNLKKYSTEGRLASLSLHVTRRGIQANGKTLDLEDDETSMLHVFALPKFTWETAIRTFNVTMAALQDSGLCVDDHLNIFDDVEACSLPYDALVSLNRQFASTTVFSSLKRLSVSLSSPYRDNVDGGALDSAIEDSRRSIQGTHGINALQGLLGMSTIMPSLKSLDVHWYNILHFASATQSETRVQIKPQLAFTQLSRCRIRGIHTTESDILQFVKNIHPKSICLADVSLETGSYASIFDYITTPDSSVIHFYFDDLYEGSALVHFDVPGVSKFRYRGSTMGPSTLKSCGDDPKEAIHYRIPSGRALGSPERTRWLQSKTAEYGAQPGSATR
ncbi:hypothetical protein GGR51DRAFT_535127 [Nemania sp. FL0031]|nr:hypothetical protein GGR51DRAFT_535127 [Nemania sp. FL0031]